ncbi:hypothetical protein acsn021_05390 [Anaerocolumna cellulosilytica]|uniref:Uncharacterized protein n=1 Tax=Anaerocolumna cellulosilytica TaxID=433286 RepID=A0A6S6R0Z3_9FIRM|nr:hypothetical protein [Anaerocolumna cellulosilytica]MBB5195694.1 hypothetical protein [Anaerocolumna cellulosilytica]BCJ92970.1 hypothetical protein acsn021_05390 [Anaerocolumna cellulosilytica]
MNNKKSLITLRIALSIIFLVSAILLGFAFFKDTSKIILPICIFVLITQAVYNAYKVYRDKKSFKKMG